MSAARRLWARGYYVNVGRARASARARVRYSQRACASVARMSPCERSELAPTFARSSSSSAASTNCSSSSQPPSAAPWGGESVAEMATDASAAPASTTPPRDRPGAPLLGRQTSATRRRWCSKSKKSIGSNPHPSSKYNAAPRSKAQQRWSEARKAVMETETSWRCDWSPSHSTAFNKRRRSSVPADASDASDAARGRHPAADAPRCWASPSRISACASAAESGCATKFQARPAASAPLGAASAPLGRSAGAVSKTSAKQTVCRALEPSSRVVITTSNWSASPFARGWRGPCEPRRAAASRSRRRRLA
mmetsp:Transcript_1956/g.7140  ORF Transcript_1956/g.7140 Transcript_1956/m.7140 type:complete len:308 (+) Transcript_1956:78-1001(+)